MKVVFFGTTRFGLASLRALYENRYEIPLVVTEPLDYETGAVSPVLAYAEERGIPVVSSDDPAGDGSVLEAVKNAAPDAVVCAGYGRILPPEFLRVSQIGCLGVHASLLPRWRGPAPVRHTVLAGDLQSGITIFAMTEAVDAGDIIARMPCTAVGKTEEELYDELSETGGMMIVYVLGAIYSVIRLIPQDDAFATYAPL